jgi:Protein of unknown function, DUF547
MKKINYYLVIALSFALVLGACSGNSSADSADTKPNDELNSEESSTPKTETKTVTTVDENGKKTTTTVEVPVADSKSNNASVGNSDPDPSKGSGGFTTDEKKSPTNDPPLITNVVEAEVSDSNFHKYEKLNTFLGKYVTGAGNVNYASIKSNKAELEEILKEYESTNPASDWTNAQKLTYWINAYNIYTIKLIVDNYPTTSITSITAKPWHKSFIKLNGKTYSLNQIENDIIRKQFNEPRVHFALNCASKSCPILLNKAYLPATVYTQMTAQTKRFLNDTSKNTFGAKEVKISKIFEWYVEDFTKGGSTVIDFINKYRTEQLTNQKILYSDYSWDLNK